MPGTGSGLGIRRDAVVRVVAAACVRGTGAGPPGTDVDGTAGPGV